jgi:class 3 adenylate cyclase
MGSRPVPVRVLIWTFHLALPILILWLLLTQPKADVRWQHNAAHFWLITTAALISAVIGVRISEDARHRKDARLFLVSLAFLCSAGFLAMHALATPNIIVSGSNAGFVIATPVGLLLAAGFAVASGLEISPRWSARILDHQAALRGGIVALLVAWGVISLANLPPLDHKIANEAAKGPLLGIAAAASLLFLVAAGRYYAVHRRRPSVLLLSIVTAFFLLGEAMVGISLSRTWQASWWEWHVLLFAGYAFVAYSAYVQYRREGSARGLFASISLEQTLRVIREEYGTALESLVTAIDAQAQGREAAPVGALAVRLGERFGLSEGQTGVLERAAEALTEERTQIRRLGASVAVGQEASVIRHEADLLERALSLLGGAYRNDGLRLGVLHEGNMRYVGAATRSGAPTVPDGAAEARLRDEALASLAPAEGRADGMSLFVIPLTVKGRAAGMLEVARAGAEFADRDRALLQSLSSQLSIALENARLYHQLDGLFRQYMSPDVATALVADPDQAALGGAIEEVTILFADLRGFTPFSERSSPEHIVTVLNEYFGRAVPLILAQGGTVVQFVGDAVMALFNAPTRQPDHALRAARSALDMQESIESLAAENPSWPRFRVGVNTGPALVGNIGSAEMRNFTAIGDTTNLAARLETSAEVGQVVIGAATYEQIRDVAEVRPLDPLDLKGKSEPVEAYVLVGLRTNPGEP